jgi:hypothetical protein
VKFPDESALKSVISLQDFPDADAMRQLKAGAGQRSCLFTLALASSGVVAGPSLALSLALGEEGTGEMETVRWSKVGEREDAELEPRPWDLGSGAVKWSFCCSF